jgi:hypothetical protein
MTLPPAARTASTNARQFLRCHHSESVIETFSL